MNQSNQFEPPSACADPDEESTSPDALRGEPRRAPAANGLSWVGDGARLFARDWGTWILMLLVFGGLFVVISLLPVISILSGFAFPIFIGGWMLAADRVHRGESAHLEDLFAGFTGDYIKPMAITGAIYVAASLAIMVLSGIVGFALIGGSFMSGAEPSVESMLLSMALLFLVMMALMLPLLMMIWFAPALIMLNGVAPTEALKMSFFGCLRNIFPMLIYGLICTMLLIAGALPLFLGWLVVYPIFLCSIYSAYRDVYLDD